MPKVIEGLKERLLETLEDLIKEGGSEIISMRTLAKRCDVAVGTVYNYFPGKSDLLMAMFKREWTRVLHRMKKSLTGTPKRDHRPDSALMEIIEIIYEEMEAHHALFLQNKHAWQRLEGNDPPPFPLLTEGPRWLDSQLAPHLEEILDMEETTAVQTAALLLSTTRKLIQVYPEWRNKNITFIKRVLLSIAGGELSEEQQQE